MSLNILIAPSGFKESLGAPEVADHIAEGVLRAMPLAHVVRAPMVDGGEGFTEALVKVTQGTMHTCTVTGPVGQPVESFFGILGGRIQKTAVLEMAAAAGLRLVPRDQRDPTKTTSYGVGELIRAALDAGAQRILLGCGDSGINDGGAGMAQALGARLLDDNGQEVGQGGAELTRIAKIDLSGLDKRLNKVQLDAAVNWHNVLLGERGVARVFGPQKGATPEQVEILDAALINYSRRIFEATGIDMSSAPGGGASGGLGAAFAGLLGGLLHPRYDIVMNYLELDRLIEEADLVITAEGSLDGQTPYGKIPAEVARRAKLRGLPVIALAGTIGKGVASNFEYGIDAFASILKRPCSLDEAILKAGSLLTRAADDAVRMMMVGMRLAVPRAAVPARRVKRTLMAVC
ncbi:glycerate kinase [Variovorax sp. PCZ-1]|uniref:glycerate kinase family protein n=1 Tax=Variovorax sp. PCZ-1 TaxID=2835533 RepID=UPI001BCFB319|nr:glycerate kinase [Variovorax sp. PCZ-1]MBS7806509.1 glycerate kinase [Variovorax sp. PCZ-1]